MSEYISRQKTIDFIKSEQCKQCSDIGLCGKCAVLVAIDLIKTAPTADVARVVHGHWIVCEDFGLKCSCCQEKYAPRKCRNYQPPYCEECGAKMDESEENNV